MENYAQQALTALRQHIDVEGGLLDLYALLALVKGERTTLKDVHDAWSIWRNNTKPDHRSLVPFEELTLDVQELDREYAEAIRAVAREL